MNTIQKKYISAFTLIELVIVITIIGIITVSTYIPYAHHQKKVLLQQGAREISQSLRDVRSLAINGFNIGSGNVNVGLFVGSGASSLIYYTYPYGDVISLSDMSSGIIYKEKKLPKGIKVDSINSSTQDVLFTFSAIEGSGAIDPLTSTGVIDIQISFGGSTEAVLQKHISYYTQSYISDY